MAKSLGLIVFRVSWVSFGFGVLRVQGFGVSSCGLSSGLRGVRDSFGFTFRAFRVYSELENLRIMTLAGQLSQTQV